MDISAVESPKLQLVSQDGFAMSISRQASYEYHWHTHDCAMLMWPSTGGLRSAWMETPSGSQGVRKHTLSLTRGMAILIPADTAHCTRSDTRHQQHGELYLAPELLRACPARGPICLDAPSLAMLDALRSPALDAASAQWLLKALLAQLSMSHRIDHVAASMTLPQKMIDSFSDALDADRILPSVETMACTLGVSARTLQRLCLNELGKTPVAVRRQMLADRVRAQLLLGLPLAEVSMRFGFANSGHLTRLLKNVGKDA